jgi:hypothetical protein
MRGVWRAVGILLLLGSTPDLAEAKRLPKERMVTHRGTIAGSVRHHETGEAMVGAMVKLYCTCLQFSLRTVTDESGNYRFVRLPPGAYTVDARIKDALVGKRFKLLRNAKYRVNFWINPEDQMPKLIEMEPPPPPKDRSPKDWVPKSVVEKHKPRMPAAFRHLEHVDWAVPLRHYD